MGNFWKCSIFSIWAKWEIFCLNYLVTLSRVSKQYTYSSVCKLFSMSTKKEFFLLAMTLKRLQNECFFAINMKVWSFDPYPPPTHLTTLKILLKDKGQIFFGFPPWYMPFGGHQQVAHKKWTSKLPYYHILPMPIYKAILISQIV